MATSAVWAKLLPPLRPRFHDAAGRYPWLMLMLVPDDRVPILLQNGLPFREQNHFHLYGTGVTRGVLTDEVVCVYGRVDTRGAPAVQQALIEFNSLASEAGSLLSGSWVDEVGYDCFIALWVGFVVRQLREHAPHLLKTSGSTTTGDVTTDHNGQFFMSPFTASIYAIEFALAEPVIPSPVQAPKGTSRGPEKRVTCDGFGFITALGGGRFVDPWGKPVAPPDSTVELFDAFLKIPPAPDGYSRVTREFVAAFGTTPDRVLRTLEKSGDYGTAIECPKVKGRGGYIVRIGTQTTTP